MISSQATRPTAWSKSASEPHNGGLKERKYKIKGKRKMNKNKIATEFALFLMFAMTSSLVALPAGNAHTPAWNLKTYAYISIEPDPVGVGQLAYVNFWIDKVPPTANAQYGDRWHNFTVTVTDPNGDKETLGPFTSDDTGGAHTTYAPDKLGNYTFVFNFPGETIEGVNPAPTGTYQPETIGDHYEASTSSVATLVVQEESVPYYPSTPLPSNYWTRPIYSENLDWYQIGGNWFGFSMTSHGGSMYNVSGNFNPYTTAPSSAHIMWTQPLAPGGIIGGEFGGSEYGSSYYQTPQYEPKFQAIVINGILYYTRVPGSSTYKEGWIAVDMRTGQTVWTKDTTSTLMCGQVLRYISPNQFGGLSYLWSKEPTVAPNTGTTYGLYDAMTGNWILNIVNGTSFSQIVEDDGGSLLGYYTNNTDHTLVMWNSTKAIIGPTDVPAGYPVGWMWRPTQGAEIPFDYGIQMKAPLVTTYNSEPIAPNLSIMTMSSDIVLLHSTPVARFGVGWDLWVGYDAHTGQKLWATNHTYTPGDRISDSPAMQGMIFEFDNPSMTWTAYSLTTGQKLWGPTEPYPNPWGYFVCYAPIAAYGMLYQADFAGYVHAWNMTTGKEVWTFFSGTSGYETPYGNYPLYHIEAVADGKIYVEGGHTYSPPIFRGSQLWCINATTGEKIWSVSSFTESNNPIGVIADGILVEPNAYDNQIYAFGMGPTKTTVTAPSVGVTTETPVTISGTVTDISAGSQQNAVAMNFPNGLPCVSDASMTQFMEAVYEQQPMPSNVTGVPVTISVLDSNGNQYSIGTTTTNAMGVYGLTWTPSISGNFTVFATFGGTQSYYGSSASACFYASEAPAATPAPTSPPASMADLYLLPGIVGIIIAIAVVGAVLVLMLRKR
jgi:hypothetical protein